MVGHSKGTARHGTVSDPSGIPGAIPPATQAPKPIQGKPVSQRPGSSLERAGRGASCVYTDAVPMKKGRPPTGISIGNAT